MIFPFFASVIVFCIWLAYEIRKSTRKDEKAEREFWEREAAADATRKKPLDNLNYIVIPEEVLKPFCDKNGDILPITPGMDSMFSEALTAFAHLKDSKIVNLSHISNTDLKLTYGAANLPTLTLYDQNFLLLIRILHSMGEYFRENKDNEKAKTMLEFAISAGSASIGTYKLRSEIYVEEEDYSKINYLISSASLLTGLTKGPILKNLKELSKTDSSYEESILDILD